MSVSLPLSVKDQLAIHNLYALYNLASDAADEVAYADCFTDDGLMLSEEVGIEVRGRGALLEHKERDKANRKGRYRRHWNGNLYLESLENGEVRGRCYLIAYNGNPGELPTIADCGVYEDKLVKINGQWKFSSRILRMDASTWKTRA